MLERYLQSLHTEEVGLETPAETRERYKELFSRNTTRRMTQLGLLVGVALEKQACTEADTVVYLSTYGETRALEGYIDSFPGPSPTLFQTSVQPSGVQQAMIARQRAIGPFFPLTGERDLPARGLQVALLANTPRSVLCGGEERGSWLLEHRTASDRTFAFAATFTADADQALARVTLRPTSERGALTLPAFFQVLHEHRPFSGAVADGLHLELAWSS